MIGTPRRAMGDVPEHIVERCGRAAVQVRRTGEHRNERGNVESERAARLHIGGVVGANLVAHAVGEQRRDRTCRRDRGT